MGMPQFDLAKAANLSQILSFFPGTYCAYGTWVLLHPGTGQVGSALAPQPVPMAPPALLGSFIIFAACLALGFILRIASTRRQHPGVTVESAKWYCTRVRKAQRDVTREIQGMVRENGLLVHAHDNVFGDICKDHDGSGDPKTLEIELTYHLHVTATHDGWINLCGPQVGPQGDGPHPPVPIRNNQELREQIDKLRSDFMKADNAAQGWMEEAKAKALELHAATLKLSEAQASRHRAELLATEILELKREVGELTKQNQRLKEDLANPHATIRRAVGEMVDAALISSAPKLLIDYSVGPDGKGNVLTMFNDGSETLYGWNLRPLVLTYKKQLWSIYGNPSITSKNKIVQEVSFDGPGDMTLVDFLRSRLPEIGTEVVTEVYYSDGNGQGFVRPFTLKAYQNGALIWEPGEIRPQPHQSV